jgi:hypothetical protein
MLTIVGGIVLWLLIVFGLIHVVKTISNAAKISEGNKPE